LQKIAYIFILITFTSCSVFKRQNASKLIYEENGLSINRIERIRKLNISNQNFFISKAEVQIISGDENEVFLASVKFLFPDKYLISLRSKTGVEGARVFLTGDTILINDRINRTLFYGNPDYISRKFGISPAAVPLFFGDLVFTDLRNQDDVKCDDGLIDINSTISGLKFEAVADCRFLKMISCIQINDREGEQVKIYYSEFNEIGEFVAPSRIILEYEKIKVLIAIKRLEIPWDGSFDFIPGSKYERIPLK